MQIGLGIGIPFTKSQVWLAVQAVFTPAKLFESGANGLWLDPSDLTTMFQDPAGTTPVTAVEQPVGLILDKSKGLVLGPELVGNGTFDGGSGAGWTKFSGTTANFSGNSLLISGVGGFTGYYYPIVVVQNRWYRFTCTVIQASAGTGANIATVGAGAGLVAITASGNGTAYFNSGSNTTLWVYCNVGAGYTAEYDNISVRELPGNHAFQSTSANRPTLSARYNQYVGTEAMATQNVTTLATSYKLTFSGAGSITLSGTATGTYTAGTYTVTCTAGTLTSTVSGSVTQASLVPANQSSLPYQRVNTATDYDSDQTKFPWYLKFNGTSSSLQTASINFTATDKMFVSAGVRKLSDATAGMLSELSSDAGSSAGAFHVTSAGYLSNTADYNYILRGSIPVVGVAGVAITGISAPITSVLSSAMDIAASSVLNEIKLRANGVYSNNVVSDPRGAGTGNYGNYPLYIGARAGSSLFFNGDLYQLVIAGKQASAEEITSTETYINTKTKAY